MIGPKRLYQRIRNVVRSSRGSVKNYRILSSGLGQMNSMRKMQSVDKEGNAVPWFTYPAIEYLKQLDFTGKRIFEFGSGNSTMFWASRAKHVVAIEEDKIWYNRMKSQLPSNVEYILTEDRQAYIDSITKQEGVFDIIVNDGIYRYDCAVAARPKLADDGFIILDNSEWCVKTSGYYRDCDLIEVDMSGFGPINTYSWVTSFYFTRNVKLKPAHAVQPVLGIGGEMLSEKELAEWIQG